MRYEFKDDQLWDNEYDCWVMWRTVSGRIGMSDEFRAEIIAAINPCWGAADEFNAAIREDLDAAKVLTSRAEALLREVICADVGPDCWEKKRADWLRDYEALKK